MKYWNMLVEKFGLTYVLMACASVVILILFVFLYRAIKLKKYRKEIVDLENKMNAIKSYPIQYKLGRAIGIVKNLPELKDKYDEYLAEYENIVELQTEELVPLINDVDEGLYYRKLRGVKKNLGKIREVLDEYEKKSDDLLAKVEEITEVENQQRLVIIKVKEQFRNTTDNYSKLRSRIEDYAPKMLDMITGIDDDFVELEKYMNDQDFATASKATQDILAKIEHADVLIEKLPTLIAESRQYFPQKIEELQRSMDSMKKRSFAIERLQAPMRMNKIEADIANIESRIKNLDIDDIDQDILLISEEMESLHNDFEKEESSFAKYDETRVKCFKNAEAIHNGLTSAKDTIQDLQKNYILDDYTITIEEDYENFQAIIDELAGLQDIIESKDFSYSQMIEDLESVNEKCKPFNDSLIKHEELANSLRIQEKRALDELDNINIVLLEIKSEIRNKHLPMINDSYKDYISDSYQKADAILNFIRQRPIDLKNLSMQVDAARDVIYKLYDNVHNLIVTAEMVEDAIIYGNRYRSSFIEVNTELTKAELLYRNGEYTKALSTAVDIIEKIKPNSYEMLIKNKSPQ